MLAIEAVGLARAPHGHLGPVLAAGDVQLQRHSEQLVIARHDGIEWFFCGLGDSCMRETDACGGAAAALAQIRGLLRGAGADFGQVVRTWLYLGGIVAEEGRVQRYQELNRARDEFYRDITFLRTLAPPRGNRTAYPASTGIGMGGRGVSAGAIAVGNGREDLTATPLENPRQTAAYDYRAAYSPNAPRFSRAMAVRCGGQAMIFISGTASITRSETRHPQDPVAQTEETLDNIEALIAEDNLAGHGLPGFGARLADLASARVYVKRQEDYPRIRAACEKRWGELPAVYVAADVCRPDLLVEIEGIAFSAPPPPGGAGLAGGTRHLRFHAGHPLPAAHEAAAIVAPASSPQRGHG
jgi:enamine deaminase RidA (YjgF/YER057c/UK114 family)